MNLFLLRHGIAVDRGTPGFEDDSLRPLTPKGAARIHRIAQATKRLRLKFDLIFPAPICAPSRRRIWWLLFMGLKTNCA